MTALALKSRSKSGPTASAHTRSTATTAHTRVYDLVGNRPSFPKASDIVVADAIDSYWLHASLDRRVMFAPGPSTFVVVPLP